MGVETTLQLTCDLCPEVTNQVVAGSGFGIAEMRKWAKSDGWKRHRGADPNSEDTLKWFDICPDCQMRLADYLSVLGIETRSSK